MTHRRDPGPLGIISGGMPASVGWMSLGRRYWRNSVGWHAWGLGSARLLRPVVSGAWPVLARRACRWRLLQRRLGWQFRPGPSVSIPRVESCGVSRISWHGCGLRDWVLRDWVLRAELMRRLLPRAWLRRPRVLWSRLARRWLPRVRVTQAGWMWRWLLRSR